MNSTALEPPRPSGACAPKRTLQSTLVANGWTLLPPQNFPSIGIGNLARARGESSIGPSIDYLRAPSPLRAETFRAARTRHETPPPRSGAIRLDV
jgi:hypothetical protein